MKPNVHGFAFIDHISRNSKKFAFQNTVGVCCGPDVDGEKYSSSIDLGKENMMKNDVGIKEMVIRIITRETISNDCK